MEKYINARVASLEGPERQKIKEEIIKRVEKAKEKEANGKPQESESENKSVELGDKEALENHKEANTDQDKEKQESKPISNN